MMYQWRHLELVRDNPLPMRPICIAIAEWGKGGIYSLGCLLQHSLLRLLGEVIDVVLSHEHLDTMHELLGGSGVACQYHILLDEMDFQIKVVQRHPVLQV